MWLFLHGGIAIALGLSIFVAGPVRINTNLFDILPASHALKSVDPAEKILSSRNTRQVYILAKSADFAQARQGAAQLYQEFADSTSFETIALYVDETVLAQCIEYIHTYRYAVLDAETRGLLENNQADVLADDALAAIFGAFTITPLDHIDTDPFFLTDRIMKRFLESSLLSSGAMSLQEDVLAAQYEGSWYVMIRGTLSPAGVSLTNADSAVAKIYAVCTRIKAEHPGLDFSYSGVPFHSYESSSSAQHEISLISSITMLIIIALFLWVFRSPLPALVCVADMGTSILLATATTLLFFREIHILTFVFGTTLIGICIDCSIHYFIHWKGNPGLKTGHAIRSHISRSITMSIVSTEICFAALFLAPFMILKQFALFSLSGLLSSFCTTMSLYPKLKNPPALKRQVPRFVPVPQTLRNTVKGSSWKKAGMALILVSALVLLFVNRDKVRIENNITSLYTMSDGLLASEKIAAQVLNHGSSGWYFIVSGSSPEETLEHEEQLRSRLDMEITQGNLQSYLAVSLFIPSRAVQRRNYEAAKALLPLASRQFEYLGFPQESVALFGQDFDAAQETCISPEGDMPGFLKDLTANLWIGKAGTQYYTCVLPLHTKNESAFRAIAADLDSVFFVNKVQDIGRELDGLTRIMLLLFAAAYVLISGIVAFFYTRSQTLRICAIPCVLIVVSLAVLASLDIPLGFFSVVGMILVFGLGLDYMFYMIESEKQALGSGGSNAGSGLTVLAIVLSFATTGLSFGALVLSSFVPVHMFGLTVFVGLSAAFVSALLLRS